MKIADVQSLDDLKVWGAEVQVRLDRIDPPIGSPVVAEHIAKGEGSDVISVAADSIAKR